MKSGRSQIALGLVLLIVVTIVLPAMGQAMDAEHVVAALPEGREMTDEELLATEGEFWWFVVAMVLGGGARAVYENWFDEDYGIDRDDGREIAGTALACGVGGSCAGTAAASAAFVR
ncbi:hypothetical protein JW848_08030 [Candidatus Bipolaricaulota bacterium]|nr:hypothetical protein [Candidatus Bipolaricaulota bacterium]